MSLSKSSLTFACGISAILLSGCATSTLIKKDSNKTYTRTNKVTLIEDPQPSHRWTTEKLCTHARWTPICQFNWQT